MGTIYKDCGVSSDEFDIFFVYNPEKSFITACAYSFVDKTKMIPHIIYNELDSEKIENCVQLLARSKCISTTQLYATTIDSGQPLMLNTSNNCVVNATCLISLPVIHEETGIILSMPKFVRDMRLMSIASKLIVPIYVDCTELFGRNLIDLRKYSVDAISARFHKIGGPIDCGIIIVKKSITEAFELTQYLDIISNMDLILKAKDAYESSMADRQKLLQTVTAVRKKLSEELECVVTGTYPYIFSAVMGTGVCTRKLGINGNKNKIKKIKGKLGACGCCGSIIRIELDGKSDMWQDIMRKLK